MTCALCGGGKRALRDGLGKHDRKKDPMMTDRRILASLPSKYINEWSILRFTILITVQPVLC